MTEKDKNVTIIVQQCGESSKHECSNCGADISVITDGIKIPLLDKFAGDALKGLLARNTGELSNGELEKITDRAYEIAETMMQARRELAADAKITVARQPD